MKPLPTLPTLPTELQESIICHLGAESTLNVSKTCRTLADTALPHLYHEINLTWQVESEPSRKPRIASLLRSILASPNRAASIKAIKLNANGFTARKEGRLSLPKKVPDLLEKDVTAAAHALSAAKMPERSKWETGLREKELDTVLALLLSRCINLQSLFLGAYFLHANVMLPIMLNHMLNRPRSAIVSDFSKLENISLGVDLNEYKRDFFFLQFTTEAVLPFFYLPALKGARILLVDAHKTQPLPWPLSFRPTAMALTSLRLQRSRASATTVSKLLAICPSLTAFEYDYRPRVNQPLNCAILMQALSSYNKTLRHLRICLQPFSNDTLVPWDFGEDDFLDGNIGPWLGNFVAMETLEIPLVVLLGWHASAAAPLSSVLPLNLQALTIRDDCWEFLDWEWSDKEYTKLFYVFLKHGRWRDVCPHLRFINLRLEQSMEDDWLEERREKFRKMCQVKGLDCGIYKLHKDINMSTGEKIHKEPGDNGEVFGTFFE